MEYNDDITHWKILNWSLKVLKQMKIKVTVFIIFVFSLFFSIILAQKLPLQEKNILDTTKIICTYKYSYIQDTSNPTITTENRMILEIGDSLSKFYDYKYYLFDSTMVAEYSTTKFEDNKKDYPQIIRNGIKLQTYKNYPEGKITVVDRIPFDNYKYEEPLTYPKWKLENEKKIFCGYSCLKAITSFRGRNYTAWYAPEIPISDGPWKFGGLPGLILKIEDDKKHHIFEMVGLERPKVNRPIFINKSLYLKTTLSEFLKLQREYMQNPTAFVETSNMVQSTLPASARRARPYNPIELSE